MVTKWLYRHDWVKGFEMKLPWIIQAGPKCNHKAILIRGRRDKQNRGRQHDHRDRYESKCVATSQEVGSHQTLEEARNGSS